jgi:hypothetical protein
MKTTLPECFQRKEQNNTYESDILPCESRMYILCLHVLTIKIQKLQEKLI